MLFRPTTLAEARKRVLAAPPRLSLVVLNWNRRALLEKTVYSLLATSPADVELFVVDNASTDGSCQWITEFARLRPGVEAVGFAENRGGEALNPVLERCAGEFILISENDMEYRPGWWVEMLAPLVALSEIGQISPLSPFPSP